MSLLYFYWQSFKKKDAFVYICFFLLSYKTFILSMAFFSASICMFNLSKEYLNEKVPHDHCTCVLCRKSKTFELADSNESKNLIGTIELKTHFYLLGPIFSGIFFF